MTANSPSTEHPTEALLAYVENALAATERRRVELHLKGCDPCRRDAEFIRLAATHLVLDGMEKRLEQGLLSREAAAPVALDPDAILQRARDRAEGGLVAWARRRWAELTEQARAFATPVHVGAAVAVLLVALAAGEMLRRGTGPSGPSVVASLPPVIEETTIVLRGGDSPSDRDRVRLEVEQAIHAMKMASMQSPGAAPWFGQEPDAASVQAMLAGREESRFLLPIVRIDGPTRYRVSARVVDRSGAVLAETQEWTSTPEALSRAVRKAAESAIEAAAAK
ncbi:MAG: zf-HC2 domain-containing protein [Nitrospirae bacterium]|nr:zf-HC2 domain-containing protein [Nitrospirota bacterium]